MRLQGKELTPDVWRRVLFFLHREVPVAGSRPKRRETSQGDLVAMMRIFYDLTIPFIYTSVICSDLNPLLYTHPKEHCSGRVAGKACHFDRIKHLFIEHSDKSYIRHDDRRAFDSAYQMELNNLYRALSNPLFSKPGGPWPNLETLSLCSIYPPDPISWNIFCRPSFDPSRGRLVRQVSELMPLLITSPTLKHICQRGGGGLLNFPLIIDKSLSSSAILTTHITPGEEYWTITLGSSCRWILNPSSTPTSNILRKAIESVLTLGASMRPWQAQPTDQRILLDIYASGKDAQESFNRRVDDSLPPGWRWEGMTAVFWDCLDGKDMQEIIKEIMGQIPECRTGKDEIRWLPGRKATRCGSCGS